MPYQSCIPGIIALLAAASPALSSLHELHLLGLERPALAAAAVDPLILDGLATLELWASDDAVLWSQSRAELDTLTAQRATLESEIGSTGPTESLTARHSAHAQR